MSDSIVIALGWVTVIAGAGVVVLGNRGLRAAQPFLVPTHFFRLMMFRRSR